MMRLFAFHVCSQNNLWDRKLKTPQHWNPIFLQLLQTEICKLLKNIHYPLLMRYIWEQLNFLLVYFGTYYLLILKLLHVIQEYFTSFQTFWDQWDLHPLFFFVFLSSVRIRIFNWFYAVFVAVSMNGVPFVLYLFLLK